MKCRFSEVRTSKIVCKHSGDSFGRGQVELWMPAEFSPLSPAAEEHQKAAEVHLGLKLQRKVGRTQEKCMKWMMTVQETQERVVMRQVYP